nr:reverse transcriptase domain-containing protein [Tanacetum cinerariifolium]
MSSFTIVANLLELPNKLHGFHNTFHVSNLKRCFVNNDVVIPLDEVQLDDKLHFVEEPVEIMDREVKRLKQSRIPIVKVRWNTRRGPKFTWERKDFFRSKPVAYKLELPDKLHTIHDTFHVSNLKRCFVNDNVVIPLDEVQLDDKLHFVKEPVEIMDREVKRLKQSRILIVKVRWNSRRGPKFTWEREDFFRSKYHHLFARRHVTRQGKLWDVAS